MKVDYFSSGEPSVLWLITELQQIVNDNPAIDFNKVGVTLNSGEYTLNRVGLIDWQHKGMSRFCVDID